MNSLTGWRVLIAEDEPVIALDMQFAFEDRGAEVAGPVASVRAALDLLAQDGAINAAVLNLKLGDSWAFAVAEVLEHKGIPLAFVTGYERARVPPRFSSVPYLEMSAPVERLVSALHELWSAPAGQTIGLRKPTGLATGPPS